MLHNLKFKGEGVSLSRPTVRGIEG